MQKTIEKYVIFYMISSVNVIYVYLMHLEKNNCVLYQSEENKYFFH